MKKLRKIISLLFLSCSLVGCSFNQTIPPYIGDNGNWFVDGADTGIPARGEPGKDGQDGQDGTDGKDGQDGEDGKDGITPTIEISEDGYWIINGEKTNVKAEGQDGANGADGKTPYVGENGNWFIDGVDTGIPATGQDGIDGEDGITPTIEINEDGYWVINGQVTEIKAEGSDGNSPFIGENGNWWIGDEDTGVVANPSEDTRGFTDGLIFEIRTANGKSGMVVTGYDGTDSNVIIPNKVSFLPVIGIGANAFNANETIKTVSFSCNTVYLGESAFEACPNLEEVDFNNCKLETIGARAFFQDIKLQEIILPDTVTRLENECFAQTTLNFLNYGNITYFGDECLSEGLFSQYIYLDKDVTYVGEDAFTSGNYIYLEIDTIPETWGKRLDGEFGDNELVILNCRKNDEWIYSINEDGITVHQYLKDADYLIIPSQIDNQTVTELGVGFNSYHPLILNDKDVDFFEEHSLSIYEPIKEIYVADTVKRIDYYALGVFDAFIYIPSSIEMMSSLPFSNYNRIIFEGSSLPAIKRDYLDTSSDFDTNSLKFVNYDFNVARDSIEVDRVNRYYYSLNNDEYTLLSYLGNETNIVIPTTFNDKPVTTISTGAIFGDDENNNYLIEIGEGIERIRSKGLQFDNQSTIISLNSNISIINANGIVGDNLVSIAVNGASKPLDWDSLWTNVTSITYLKFDGQIRIYNNQMVYAINESNEIELLKFTGDSQGIVYIPREINGIKVTTIKSNFLSTTRSNYSTFNLEIIYIPNTITNIEYHAFDIYASSLDLVIISVESSDDQSSYDPNWVQNSNVGGESTSNISIRYGEYYPKSFKTNGDFIYSDEGEEIQLLKYIGSSSTINIPRSIDSKPVTAIRTFFVKESKAIQVRVPNNVINIYERAFQSTISSYSSSYYWNFYFEGDSSSINLDAGFYYNIYHNTSSYKNVYYNQTLNY